MPTEATTGELHAHPAAAKAPRITDTPNKNAAEFSVAFLLGVSASKIFHPVSSIFQKHHRYHLNLSIFCELIPSPDIFSRYLWRI
jgi:hypothetical protein